MSGGSGLVRVGTGEAPVHCDFYTNRTKPDQIDGLSV